MRFLLRIIVAQRMKLICQNFFIEGHPSKIHKFPCCSLYEAAWKLREFSIYRRNTRYIYIQYTHSSLLSSRNEVSEFRRKNRVTRENCDNLTLVAINKLPIIFVKIGRRCPSTSVNNEEVTRGKGKTWLGPKH